MLGMLPEGLGRVTIRLILEQLADLSTEDQERVQAWLATSLRHRH